jgi:azurin
VRAGAVRIAGLRLAVLLVAALTATACGGTLVAITPPPATPTPEPTPTQASPSPTPPASEPSSSGQPAASPSPAEPVKVALAIDTAAGATDFHYAAGSLAAPAGSKITLKLTNRTNPDDEIGHNWVLVKPGQEESVLANAIKAGDDNDWLDVADPGVIAATKLIEGNDKNIVTFDAPPPGSYTFLCTFPDHYKGGMKGTLTIG